MNPGRLIFPAIRWDQSGYEAARDSIERGLALGAGGFILFGGPADAAAALIDELQARSAHPLLIGADLERGAGQQFHGATPLPPAAAIGALDDVQLTRRAAELTAREARAIGVNWIYAPVADVDLEPNNPIVGTRAFGSDPHRVALHVEAWIQGCHDGGALATAKHFPGHGRTIGDSHAMLPVVRATAQELDADLAPFRAAVHAGIDSIMSAHVAYPALDGSGNAATLSPAILHGILREDLLFDGLIVTDALNMAGVQESVARDKLSAVYPNAHDGRGEAVEATAALRAVAAGCDALLYPDNPEAVVAAIRAAIGDPLTERRVAQAIARIETAALRAQGMIARSGGMLRGAAQPAQRGAVREWGKEGDRAWAEALALATVSPVRGSPHLPASSFDLLIIDDDVGGPFAPARRDHFPEVLRAAGYDVRETDAVEAGRPFVIAVYCDIRAWKGRPGCSARTIDAVRRALAQRAAPVILFGHPRLAAELPGTDILAAWGGEWLMQEAAGRWLTR